MKLWYTTVEPASVFLATVYQPSQVSMESKTSSRTIPAYERCDIGHQSSAAVESTLDCDLLAAVSHELRSPLTAMLGYVELLLSDFSDPPDVLRLRQTLEVVRRNGRDLLQMLNDLLNLGGVEAGRLSVCSLPFSPRDVVHDVVALWSLEAEAKGLALSAVGVDDFPEQALGDPLRIKQVLVNFVTNALKFTPHGSIRIEASTPTVDGRPTLKFAVVDTGIGLSMEQTSRLFLPSKRPLEASPQRRQGHGLGLLICRYLAAKMGGAIEVDGQPGVGSRFMLTLPLVAVPLAAVAARYETDDAATETLVYLQPT